ncbi:MAG: hypothetical protein ACI9KN_002580 [Gammaproteobacteria bacterium]|jgi:hypothetical protein
MPIKEIAKKDWKSYFDRITKAVRGGLVHIEVDSLELGAQTEVDKLTLNGLTYEEKDAVLIVSTDEIEHTIRSPQQIYVTEGTSGLSSIKVSSADGVSQIISLTAPLKLQAVK